MDPIDHFAAEALLFEEWARNATATGESAVREAVTRLMRLYIAAIELPAAPHNTSEDETEVAGVDDAEWERIFAACGRFPFDMYWEVYDPHQVPLAEPVMGSIRDDIADIYRDVVSGLRLFQAGDRDGAAWEWQFGLRTHWSEHASGAIRALDRWLAASV